MNIEELAFMTFGKIRKDVFVVREGERYGLIVMPDQGSDTPNTMDIDELEARGGSFITRPQWDEIRPNVCFNPGDDPVDGARQLHINVTCDYYVLKDGRWGILDEMGRAILEPTYDEIRIVNQPDDENPLFDHSDYYAYVISGRVLVREGSKWGMLRCRGVVVLPLEYDSIDTVRYYVANSNVYIVSKDGRYGVVDAFGKFYIPIEYPPLHCKYVEYMWDHTIFRIDGRDGTGYVRLGDGKCLVESVWEQIDMDKLYSSFDDPCGNLFTVWKGGRCGLIFNDKGTIIPPVWDEIVPRRLTPLQDPSSYSVRRGDQWGCCDEKGNLICDAVWDEVDIFRNGVVRVKKNGQWTTIGADGQPCDAVE